MTESTTVAAAFTRLPKPGSWFYMGPVGRAGLWALLGVPLVIALGALARHLSNSGLLQPMSLSIQRAAYFLGERAFDTLLLFPALALVLFALGFRRLRRRLRASPDLVCPGCLSDLSATEHGAACAACGGHYSRADLRAYWCFLRWQWKEPLCRAGTLCAAAGMAIILASCLFSIVALRIGRPGVGPSGPLLIRSANIYPMAGAAVLAVGAHVPLQIGRRRLRRRLKDARGLLCPRCHYDLSALEPELLCPECGRTATAEELHTYWNLRAP